MKMKHVKPFLSIKIVLMISLLLCCTFKTNAMVTIFVGKGGTDIAGCGIEVDQPCLTILYAMKNIDYPSNQNISIYILPGSSAYMMKSRVTFRFSRPNYHAYVAVVGYGGKAQITSSTRFKGYSMFKLVAKHKIKSVSLLMQNLEIVRSSSLLQVVILNERQNVSVEMRDVTYTNSTGFFLHIKAYGGKINVLLSNCSITYNNFHSNWGAIYLMIKQTRWYRPRYHARIESERSNYSNNLFFDSYLFNIRGRFIRRRKNRVEFILSHSSIINNNRKDQDTKNGWLKIGTFRDELYVQMKAVEVFGNNFYGDMFGVRSYGSKVRLSVQSSFFSKNIIGPFSPLYIRALPFPLNLNVVEGSLHVEIHNSSFIRNKGGGDAREGQSGSVALFTKGLARFKVLVSSTNFRENEGKYGGGLLVNLRRYNSNMAAKISKCRLIRNKALYGGAFNFISRNGKTFTLELKENMFVDNISREQGGAVLVSSNHGTSSFFIVSTLFIKNSAGVSGGALEVHGYLTANICTSISGITLTSNKAPFGGAISTNTQTIIDKSLFHLNIGQIGGAVYCVGDHEFVVTHTSFRSDKMTLIESLASMMMSNVSIIMLDREFIGYKWAVEAFNHEGNLLQFSTPFTIRCAPNYKLVTEYRFLYVNNRSGEFADRKKFSKFRAICSPCDGSYHLTQNEYSWYNGSGQTNSVTCRPCPSGGRCAPGTVVNLPHYWGYRKGDDVGFSYCKHGYCKVDEKSYNSCEENRTGSLCSLCKNDHFLTLFSTKCIQKENCRDSNLVLVLILIIPLFFNFLLVFLIFKRLPNHSKQVQFTIASGPASFFVVLRTLYVFYQLQIFTQVPAHYGSGFFRNVHIMAGMLFQMKLYDLEPEQFYNPLLNICPSNGLSYVLKVVFSISLWPVLFICCIGVIAVIDIIRGTRKYTRVDRLAELIIAIIILSYIPLSTSLLELVKCVTVYDAYLKEDINVLFGQGDVRCYTDWQISSFVVLMLWFSPFFLILYGVAHLLKKKMRKTRKDNGEKCQDDGKQGPTQVEDQRKMKRSEEKLCLHENKTFDFFWGPFTHPFFLSMETLLHLILAVTYVYVDYVLGRLYIFSFLLFVQFLLVWCCDRYKETLLNMLDKMTTMILMFFSWLGIYDTINIYNSAKVGEKRYELHNSSDIFKMILLVLPLIFLVIYVGKAQIHRRS